MSISSVWFLMSFNCRIFVRITFLLVRLGYWSHSLSFVLWPICCFWSYSAFFYEMWCPHAWCMFFRIILSFWWIFPLMSMKCPFLSLLTSCDLKSILWESRLAMPACFLSSICLNTFFHPLSWIYPWWWNTYVTGSKRCFLFSFFLPYLKKNFFLIFWDRASLCNSLNLERFAL